jgi:hypothetical protein
MQATNVAHPPQRKPSSSKEEGQGQCFARPWADDAAMRRFAAGRVSDGTRTRDRLDHNQELYLLSYAHHADALSGDVRNLAVGSGSSDAPRE